MQDRRTKVLVGAALFEAGRGGIARLARMTVKAFASGHFDVRAISYLDRVPVEIGAIRVSTARGNKMRFAAMCLRRTMTADFLFFDAAGVAPARSRLPALRRPYALWMCGIEAWEQMRPSAGRAYREADLVLAISTHTLKKFEALHGPLPQARICPLGTETDDPPAIVQRVEGAPPTALILGRIVSTEAGKGHTELIHAWPHVVARVPSARLVIAGAGDDLETIRASAAGSPVAGNIDILGFVPEQDIEALWARTHVFAMPSRSEGFGLVFVEAMRHGIPVIASTQDAGCEVNVDGVTGYNVDLSRKNDLAERLAQLLADPVHAATLGRNGFALWQERYRFSAFRERFLSMVSAMPH